MQDSDDIRRLISNQLLNRYVGLNPDFREDHCNYRMLETFYNIVGDSDLRDLQSQIEPYIEAHATVLKKVIEANAQKFIFSQPAYLFIYFGLWHWNRKIVTEWPYDYESLLSVLRWSGYSSNIVFDA